MKKPTLLLAACCASLLVGTGPLSCAICLPTHSIEGGGADGVAFRLGQITGTLCVLGALAGIVVGARLLLRTWRKAPCREADATESGLTVEGDEFPPSPGPVPKRYGWPLLFASVGTALGLLKGLSGLAQHGGEGPDFLLGYLVGAVVGLGVAGALLGALVNFVAGPRR